MRERKTETVREKNCDSVRERERERERKREKERERERLYVRDIQGGRGLSNSPPLSLKKTRICLELKIR